MLGCGGGGACFGTVWGTRQISMGTIPAGGGPGRESAKGWRGSLVIPGWPPSSPVGAGYALWYIFKTMPWTLPSHEHKRFQRNPLAAVIVQLRFDPILKIATGVPDFQDKIRSRFSLYEERDVKVVEVEAPSVSAVRTRRVKEHRFRTRGEPTTVVLGDQGVSLEYLAHQHRDVLLPDVKLVTDSLSSTFQDVSPTRLGLRYVNVVDRDRVAADAGSPAEWSDLIEPSFLQMPAALADLAGTRFANEITSEMPVGAMTLRYGLLPASEDRLGFRLDIDRYHQESFDMADVEALVRAFADDIFQVFMAAAGPSLVDWMEEEA